MKANTIVAIALLSVMGCGQSGEPEDLGPSSAEIASSPVEIEMASTQENEAPFIEQGAVSPMEISDVVVDLGPPVETLEVVVRHGESLVVLADLAGLKAEDIADFNEVDIRSGLTAGQSLLLPLMTDEHPGFLELRDAWLQGRLDRYAAANGGLMGFSQIRVGTGDTAWHIARDVAGVPIWVLAGYNLEMDLDRLRIGDELVVPDLGRDVAEVVVDEPEG